MVLRDMHTDLLEHHPKDCLIENIHSLLEKELSPYIKASFL